MSNAHTYLHQSLASAGFCLVDSEMAATLRPDLFVTVHDASVDISAMIARQSFGRLLGVGWGLAHLEGIDHPVRVATRCTDRLAERIWIVTGRRVLDIHEADPPTPRQVADASVPAARKVAEDRLAWTRRMAEQEPPVHDCALRREILKAREELARLATTA